VSWIWIAEDVVLAIHDAQIADHGGNAGIRDIGLLTSGLQRPQQAAAYNTCTVFDLAAYYAAGIVQNHPFVDGNKRVGLVLLELFLVLNGYELAADDAECYSTIMSLASDGLTVEQVSAWIEEHATTS
jgi:death-on-curing protein